MTTEHESAGIMVRLKESTRLLHDEAEQGAFNRELVRGRLPLTLYIESLAQLWEIHRALESHLRRIAPVMPSMGAVLRDYHFQEPYLLDDLTYFGRNPESIQALEATRALTSRIDGFARISPVGLLGCQYVFEGSNNGSKFLARAVRRAYGLDEVNGTRYLDPYGDRQTSYWQAFKTDMNAQFFTPVESVSIVEGAQAAFQGVIELHRELYALTPHETGTGAALAPA